MNSLGIVCCIIAHIIGVRNQVVTNDPRSEENLEQSSPEDTPADTHTFVALIDIVFTDGSKRTCTGTIIHDNVVITAAHCFVIENHEDIQPELTATFVVIGTKKMYDTAYEQYLPIEKVITHPNFRGWTADLALVYTFAGMTSDRPVKVIPLSGEKSANPIDSNVTVISWGHYKNDELSLADGNTKSKKEKPNCPDSVSEEGKPSLHKYAREGNQQEEESSIIVSRYLTSAERNDEQNKVKHKHRNHNHKEYYNTTVIDNQKIDRTPMGSQEVFRQHTVTSPNPQAQNHALASNYKSYYKNWRRQMGTQHNKLTVEVFGFVNVQTCKKYVERAMPSIYEIKDGNDIVCYSSEEHYITSEDSGAPALYQGHLVAVTVGGVQCDGDHVAIGMRMSCFCPWIADNLPDDVNLKCCNDCCNVKHTKEDNKAGKSDRTFHKHLKRHLL